MLFPNDNVHLTTKTKPTYFTSKYHDALTHAFVTHQIDKDLYDLASDPKTVKYDEIVYLNTAETRSNSKNVTRACYPTLKLCARHLFGHFKCIRGLKNLKKVAIM